MTDADIYTLINLTRQRLQEYGCSLMDPHAYPSENFPSCWPKVDGAPAFAYVHHDAPHDIKVYAIDKSMTVGQFIDTLDVTFNMLYGRNYVPTPRVTSPGVLSGAHTHQFYGGNAQLALNAVPQMLYSAQPTDPNDPNSPCVAKPGLFTKLFGP